MYRSLACAALLAISAGTAAAQPVASLPVEFSFVDWLATGRTETIGVGDVNTSNSLFYFKEKAVAGFQSWYIFFDPRGLQDVEGTITFDTNIAELITSSPDMLAANSVYGLASGVSYGHQGATALEAGQDEASFVGNQLSFSFRATNPGDHIRVLIADPDFVAVPEPAVLALLAVGLMGFAVTSRRRRSA